jgi:hypothetical protein
MTILVARGYAPLEQYSGGPDSQGAWTDIYSLAATCYRAIDGKAPADALERVKGVLGSVREVLTPATEIGRLRYSERLLRAIDHALELNEKDRPQSIAAWRAEIVGEQAAAPAGSHVPEPAAVVAPAPLAAAHKSGPAVDTLPAQDGAPPSRRRGTRILWVTMGVAVIAIAIFAGMRYQQSVENQRQLEKQQQEELSRRQQDEIRKLEADKARRDDEDRRRLVAEKQAPPSQAEPPRLKTPPAPRVEKREPVKVAPGPATVTTPATPPANPNPPQLATAPVPPAPVPEQEGTKKPAVSEPSSGPTNAELLDKAEAAVSRGDYATALPVIQKVAAAGDPRAQALLGRLYENGLGTPRNESAAYMWYSLAVRRGNAAAGAMRDRVAGKLQPAEIRQADNTVNNWKPHRD